jgi:hypothetical protein
MKMRGFQINKLEDLIAGQDATQALRDKRLKLETKIMKYKGLIVAWEKECLNLTILIQEKEG